MEESSIEFWTRRWIKIFQKEYRMIIFSCIGCKWAKINLGRIRYSSNYQDIQAIILHINKWYTNNNKKFLIWFSMGSMITVRYATFYDDILNFVEVFYMADNKKENILLWEGQK